MGPARDSDQGDQGLLSFGNRMVNTDSAGEKHRGINIPFMPIPSTELAGLDAHAGNGTADAPEVAQSRVTDGAAMELKQKSGAQEINIPPALESTTSSPRARRKQ